MQGTPTLLRAAREHAGHGVVAASIFVNPLQFGPDEDLDRYPRSMDADLDLCAAAGVDVVFAPSVDEVYPDGEPSITVEPGPLAGMLEGAHRPGHFRGVLTVVAKLCGLVRPDRGVFGEKDYQQLVLVRRMSGDLCMGVEVVGVPTVREADGLALSSRNRYLGPEERRTAVALSRALRSAQRSASGGATAAQEAAAAELAGEPLEADYLEVRSPDLDVLDSASVGPVQARILVAARVGTTRLIDNLPLTLGAS